MQLSQSVIYALQTLLQLAESGEGVLVTRKKLATTGRMPERFLLEVLHGLVKRGILRSNRGGGGGFALGRRREEITLLDVIEAVDGPAAVGLPDFNTMPAPLRSWLQEKLDQIAERTPHGARRHYVGASRGRRSGTNVGRPGISRASSITPAMEGEDCGGGHEAINAE